MSNAQGRPECLAGTRAAQEAFGAAPGEMQHAVEAAKRQTISDTTGKPGRRYGAIDDDGAHRQAWRGKVARKVAGTILSGEIEQRFVLRGGNACADEADEVALIAVRREHIGEARRVRGFGSPPAHHEGRE